MKVSNRLSVAVVIIFTGATAAYAMVTTDPGNTIPNTGVTLIASGVLGFFSALGWVCYNLTAETPFRRQMGGLILGTLTGLIACFCGLTYIPDRPFLVIAGAIGFGMAGPELRQRIIDRFSRRLLPGDAP